MEESKTVVRQRGIRQKSLRRHCRFGRATELVFVLSAGTSIVASSFIVPSTALADDLTWTGTANTTWDLIENNWDALGATAFVLGDTAIFDAAADGATITIDHGGQISAGDLNNTASSLTITGQTGDDTLLVTGTINAEAGSLTLDVATTGNASIDGGATLALTDTFTITSSFENAGTLDIDADVLGDQTLSNNGTLTLAGDVTGTVSQTAGSTTVDGTSAVSGG
ncbi:hypothetical protein, partial [Tritonibacter multivorans]